MNEAVIRQPNVDELPNLKHIWNSVFGPIGLESFFKHIFNKELCIVAKVNNTTAAMGYLIPNGDIVCGSATYKCAMIYSVATLPEYRGKGLGTEVVNELISLSQKINYPAVVLCPSDDELFTYYSARTDLRDWFYIDEYDINEVPACKMSFPLKKVDATCYLATRERLLDNSGIIYIKQDLPALQFQEMLCHECGGGLYQVDESCAVIECQPDGAVWIKELLTPDLNNSDITSNSYIKNTLAAIADSFPSNKYVLRVPSRSNKQRRFGMLTVSEVLSDISSKVDFAPWYGLAFD